ncbi:SH3 domain-containing protein [Bacillus sp. FJAT-29790]|uniref:SH3 domain-containing protein n=1 Tax=Bacillus sp. FJAT-29790 TaxID=1895002 RepID=UPI001C2240AD|nr:SH3 domain-containing protein [Bacillus sp. FJAT-29790]MBU8879517.1 SH3 domain-containing protein [Bacillus sp. FJAT-29790]
MLRKKHAVLLFCLILLMGTGIPITKANAAGASVKIGTDNLNIRGGPGLSYPIVAKAKKGELYPMLAEEKDWIEIQLGNGQKGWVANWLVSKANSQQNSTPNIQSTNTSAIVTTDGLRVRKGPNTSFQVIGTIQKGKSFSILTVNGNWIQLKTPYGDGWVSRDYVRIQDNSANSEAANGQHGKITANSLNIRTSPSLNGNVIGKLHAGETVKIISQNREWTEISHSGKRAWISSQYVQIEKNHSESPIHVQNPGQSSVSGNMGIVTATSLTVRNTGSLNGKAIGSVSKGQGFKILEEVNNWVKVEYKPGSFGWIAGWYLDQSNVKSSAPTEQTVKGSSVKIIHDGTNIRKSPNAQSQVVQRANQGESFNILSVQKDWYEIRLSNGESGFVAGWIVSVNGSAPQIEKLGSGMHLKNKKIVLDPGHGGRDNGTTGAGGTLEKTLTLRTAQVLYDKLKASGANVILTRNNDTYIPLSSRVYTSHYHNADAFISIHYDSNPDRSVKGMTTYYFHSYQKNLAADVHYSVTSKTNLKDRSYRFGDYYVLRENKRSAILLELGYLSNPAEEMLLTTGQYQESVATGIFQGLAKHFTN